MSFQITTAFVQQYGATVMHLVQQKGSRLRDCVRTEMLAAEFGYFDQLGTAAAQKRTTRHGDTPQVDTPHSRRQVSMEDYEWADLIDQQDRLRTLADFTSPYAQSAAFGLGRSMDDIIIAAATGAAKTGKTGTTSVALPAGQKIATGVNPNGGLTIAKLITAKEILDAAENDPTEERYIAVRAKDVSNLLNTQQVTSSDYNTVKTLVQGQIDTFMGFKFIRIERLLDSTLGSVTGGIPDKGVLAWRKSGLLLAIGQNPTTKISERDDKSYATQVYMSMSIGATRM